MTRREQIVLLTMTYGIMILLSACTSLRGFLLPDFKTTFHIDNTRMGLIISISQLSSMAFSFVAGRYCLRWGQRRIVALGCFLLAVSCIVIGASPNAWILALGYIGLAGGFMFLVLGLNTILPMILIASQTLLMNLLHFFFGLGTTLSQQVIALFLEHQGNWRVLFFVVSAALVVAGFAILNGQASHSGTGHKKKHTFMYPGFSASFFAGLSLYIVCEFLMSNWIINFMREGYAMSSANAGLYTTVFFGTFTFGRLIGGFVMSSRDPLASIAASTTLSAVAVFAGLSFGVHSLMLLGISGLFFAAVYPTAASMFSSIYREGGPYMLGISSAISAFMMFAVNLLFGICNDLIGVRATFYFIPVIMLFSTGMFLLARHKKHKGLDEAVVGSL